MAGFIRKWENRIPGLLQDFFILQGLNFFPILYKTTQKNALFSTGHVEVENRKKAHSFSLIPMIKSGRYQVTAQIE